VEAERVQARAGAEANCARQNAEVQSVDVAAGRAVCVCRSGMTYNRAGSTCVTQAARLEEDKGEVATNCAKQNAELQSYDTKTGKGVCACRSGMVYNLAGSACVTQAARLEDDRRMAAANCAKQNAELQSYDAKTSQGVCACRRGMLYNRANSACVTQEARRGEDAAKCAADFPNSVLSGYKGADPQCNCPDGWTWGRDDKKRCVSVDNRRREAAQACTSQYPGSIVGNLDLANNKEDCVCPAGSNWSGAGNRSCATASVQRIPAPPPSAKGSDPTNTCVQCCFKSRDCLDRGTGQEACYNACKASCGVGPSYAAKFISTAAWNSCPAKK
jgi:RNase P/RNase MRP subunit POP5